MNHDVTISMAPWPALRIAVLFALGIWAGTIVDLSFWAAFIGMLCLLISTLLYELYANHAVKKQRTKSGGHLLYICLLFSIGIFWITAHESRPAPQYLDLGKSDHEFELHGTVTESTLTQSGNPRITLEVDSLSFQGYPTWRKPFKVEAFSSDSSDIEQLAFGRDVTVKAELNRVDQPRNPHQFNYRRFLEQRGIFLVANISEIPQSVPVADRFSWIYWQSETRKVLSGLFSGDRKTLAKAVILGDRSGLERDRQTAFSRAGLAHLMAVSGMHVGFLMAPIWFLVPLFWRFRFGGQAAFLFCMMILTAYAGVTGFAVSVVRASVMAVLLMYARCFQKQSDGLNLLGAAALIMLIINPAYLFDVGFQLSFGAVLIILTTLPASRQILPVNWRYTKSAKVYQFVMVSVLVQTGLYPILAHYFNEFSLIGPLSNTIAVPFVQGMFTLTMVNMGLAVFSPGWAAVLNTPSDAVLSGLDRWVEYITRQDFSWVEAGIPGMWFFLLWGAGIAVFASVHKPALRWKVINLFLAALLVQLSWSVWQDRQNRELIITVFDVGQADALFIQTPDGTNFFYDTGLKSFFHDSGSRVLEPELRSMGIDHIDAIIHSHPHADHIGGTKHLMETFSVGAIYQPEFDYESEVYKNMMAAAEENEIPVYHVTLGDLIELTPEIRLFVLAPHNRLTGTDPNTWSAVIRLQYGETSVLLTGDATRQTEEYLVNDYGSFLDVDLLKVGHHGSSTSSTSEFLEKVRPEKSVASLALESRFGHPHHQAAWNLVESGTRLRYTSLQGAVRYVSCGRELRYDSWQE